ncbi:MAG: FMN-binding glutamate synthase family protein [Gammaproteobacteria bacterium]|nr:FMN-binding glutamate synthase family protein [Gammaproteobacteria bacterium]
MNNELSLYLLQALAVMAVLFIVAIGVGVLSIIVIYIIDKTQTTQAVRYNFPVIGRFRYLFEHLGEFFRQYFFSQDREEMPFNRAERAWVYRAAKNLDNTIAFGSTYDLTKPGAVIFPNTAFPTLGIDAVETAPVTIGPYCEKPYLARSLFNMSAMSYGAISKPAVLALSEGAAKAGCWLNTGEGGLSKYHLAYKPDIVFQLGTAKFGVRDINGDLNDNKLRELGANDCIKMFEVKLSQGAKAGMGGLLPGDKVTPEIAAIRGITVGETCHSPNRHIDVSNVSELLNLIARIRQVTGKPCGFKTVIGDTEWLDDLCGEIKKRGIESAPDFITIDSGDGGSGAAPQSLMDYVGLPIQESLPRVIDLLSRHQIRERIKIIASGKMITPAGACWALCVGADFISSARGFMFALGCIQALQCNRNTCPTGITTHNVKLQKGLDPRLKSERIANYVKNMLLGIGNIAHSCGVEDPRHLTRKHVRIVVSYGHSKPFSELYPPVAQINTRNDAAA